ncbi:type III effector protein, partial [Escherichia coli]|nr:type III effector protein [Escherichia coli]
IPAPSADNTVFDNKMPFILSEEQIDEISFLNAYHIEKKGNKDIITLDFVSKDHAQQLNFSTTIASKNDCLHIYSINNYNAQIIFEE